MNTKFLVIIGAGSTLSDAIRAPAKRRPPLDRGFFSSAQPLGYREFGTITKYLKETYDLDPTDNSHDSLEQAMAMIYADIHNPKLEKKAVAVFRSLIMLFNRRIADTNNPLLPTNRSNLYRVIAQMLDNGTAPEEICIITFNQDLHIEKLLDHLQKTGRTKKHGRIFNFPDCYQLDGVRKRLSSPSGDSVEAFSRGKTVISQRS